MSTVLEEYVQDLKRLIGSQQQQIGNKLINGNFATLEEAKTMSGQVRGLGMAGELATELLKNRNLADEGGDGGLGDLDGNPGRGAPAKKKRTGRVRGGQSQ